MTKAEVLILLVGTNPLPNYVVAEYFIKICAECLRKIILFHTTTTAEEAKRIKLLLISKCAVTDSFIGLHQINDPRDDNNISKAVNDKICDLLEKEFVDSEPPAFHLNYTGGTKAMAVHAYRTLEAYSAENPGSLGGTSFSYLDSKEFKLSFDNVSGRNKKTKDLRNIINLNVDEVMNLHGYRPCEDNEEKTYLWTDAIRVMDEIVKRKFLDKYLSNKEIIKRWINESRKKGAVMLDELRGRLKGNNLSDERIDLFIELIEKIPRDTDNNLPASTCKFIDGTWLEGYARYKLNEYPSLYAMPCETSLNVERDILDKDKKGESKTQNCEVDHFIVNGYLLCGISCATGKNDDMKLKGFEIIHRMNQLGGEESRAVLLTPHIHYDRASEIEFDLRNETGYGTRFRIFGKEDIESGSVWDEIEDIITK